MVENYGPDSPLGRGGILKPVLLFLFCFLFSLQIVLQQQHLVIYISLEE